MEELQQRLKGHVKALTDIYPRDARSEENIEKAAQYIIEQFKSAGYEPREQIFEASGSTFKNIIAVYNPDGDRTIVVGAHYDAEGHDHEVVSPGADDNASGIAGMLEMARITMRETPVMEDRIEFVAYCCGEPPFFNTPRMGSHFHADMLKRESRKMAHVVCLKMIGYFSDEPASQIRRYIPDEIRDTIPPRGNFIAVVGKSGQSKFVNDFAVIMKEFTSINVVPMSNRGLDSLAQLSDQISYWKWGFNAVMVTDTAYQRNLNYHRMEDTIETLDFEKMALVVKGVLGAVRKFGREV